MTLSDSEFFAEGEVASQADRKLPVRFYVEAKLDPIASEKEGREIYREIECLTILIPGDKTLTYSGRVLPVHKQRFATQYASWKSQQAGKQEALQGTPLAGWVGITEGQRKELGYFNVFTVEQLANMSDGYASNMMGVQQMKAAAKRYVDTARSAAPMLKFQAELDKRDGTIAGLQMQIEQILAQLPSPATPAQVGEKPAKKPKE